MHASSVGNFAALIYLSTQPQKGSMKVALLQMNIAWENKKANFEKAATLIKKAAWQGADVAVLPETFATGFIMEGAANFAEKRGGETGEFLRAEAIEHNINIIGGIIERGKKKQRNTALVFARNGKLIARYAKIHPFSYTGEDKFYEAGDKIALFSLEGMKCSIIICYDLRFPELARAIALKGAEVLFVIANWPKARQMHWETLLRARAIENQFFVCGVNRVGKSPDAEYAGGSAVIDPWGEYLVKGEEGEDILISEIEAKKVREVREKFPVLKDRRAGIYRK